jgi:L-fuconolactonase
MNFVDAHHHLWDTNALRYEMLEAIPKMRGSFLPEQFRRVASDKLTASVCVEAASAGADGKDETEWLLRAIRAAGIPIRLVAWAPLTSIHAHEHIGWLRRVAGPALAGIRMGFEHGSPEVIYSETVIANIRALGKASLPFDLVIRSNMLPQVRALAAACPETTLVLDHLGKPRVDGEPDTFWLDELAALAGFPNVCCKISGLMTEAVQTTEAPEVYAPYIRHAIRVFGWNRVLFGSDWPVCTLAGTYEGWMKVVTATVAEDPPENQQRLFRSNAQRIYFREDA